MNKFWIIAGDVYKKNVKSLSFLLMILVPFVVLGVIYIAGTLASSHSSESKIAIVSDNEQLAKELAKTKTDEYSFTYVATKKAAEKQLKNQDIEAFLILQTHEEPIKAELFMESSLGSVTELTINQLVNNLQASLNAAQLNLTSEQVASLSQAASFSKTKVRFDAAGKMTTGQDNTMVQMSVSFIVSIVLWLIIITYSSIIAQEIASEKGTRIMEVILSSTKAQTHFYGKLTGVILVALTQLAIYALAVVLGYWQLKNVAFVSDFLGNVDLSGLIGNFLLFTLFFFILGVIAYSVLAALCGSLVSKPEDTAKAVQPIIYLAMIGYFIGIMVGTSDPQNIVMKVTSYIPLISSFIMPIRLANETATIGNAGISTLILLVFCVILTIFSAKLYKSNVLVYSEGGLIQSLKQSVSILRNERKQ